MPPQHPTTRIQYNRTQKYFFLSNFIITVFWFFVLARFLVLYPLLSTRFLATGIADFYLSIILSTVLLELFNYISIFRYINGSPSINNSLPKPYLSSLILVSISRLTLIFVLFNYPKISRSIFFPLLIFSQSIKELFRWFYNLQKVRLFNNLPSFIKFLRSISYLLFTPIESLSTIYLVFQSLIYRSYQIEFLPYDDLIKSYLKLYLLLYLPIFYMIYKRTLLKYFFAPSFISYSKPLSKLE